MQILLPSLNTICVRRKSFQWPKMYNRGDIPMNEATMWPQKLANGSLGINTFFGTLKNALGQGTIARSMYPIIYEV